MLRLPVYMDNHSTTRVDPRVVEAMLPLFGAMYGNYGSVTHSFGHEVREAVEQARETIATCIGASPAELVFTSGATESNNLAIFGVAERPRRKGNHIVSLQTEHKAVLDPLAALGRSGYEITLLSVEQAGTPRAGLIAAEQVASAIRDDTVLVSVMLANNEIGAIQPIAEIGRLSKQRGVLFHCDATQAVGRIPVNVQDLQVDLMSFSSHKLYGPKGVGALYVRRRAPIVRLEPRQFGGGQEHGFRSGTLNSPGIVGFGRAMEIAQGEMDEERAAIVAHAKSALRWLGGGGSRRTTQWSDAGRSSSTPAGKPEHGIFVRSGGGLALGDQGPGRELRFRLHFSEPRAEPCVTGAWLG